MSAGEFTCPRDQHLIFMVCLRGVLNHRFFLQNPKCSSLQKLVTSSRLSYFLTESFYNYSKLKKKSITSSKLILGYSTARKGLTNYKLLKISSGQTNLSAKF